MSAAVPQVSTDRDELRRKERVSMAREICSHRGESPNAVDRRGNEGWEKYEPLAGACIREAERLFAMRGAAQQPISSGGFVQMPLAPTKEIIDRMTASIDCVDVPTADDPPDRDYDYDMRKAYRAALFAAPQPASNAGVIDRGEMIKMLEDMASVNLSKEAGGRQAVRMTDALIAKGVGGDAYTAKEPDEDHPDCATDREFELFDALMGLASAITARQGWSKWVQGGVQIAPIVHKALRLTSSIPSTACGARHDAR